MAFMGNALVHGPPTLWEVLQQQAHVLCWLIHRVLSKQHGPPINNYLCIWGALS